jgi:hypothetical protein
VLARMIALHRLDVVEGQSCQFSLAASVDDEDVEFSDGVCFDEVLGR